MTWPDRLLKEALPRGSTIVDSPWPQELKVLGGTIAGVTIGTTALLLRARDRGRFESNLLMAVVMVVVVAAVIAWIHIRPTAHGCRICRVGKLPHTGDLWPHFTVAQFPGLPAGWLVLDDGGKVALQYGRRTIHVSDLDLTVVVVAVGGRVRAVRIRSERAKDLTVIASGRLALGERAAAM